MESTQTIALEYGQLALQQRREPTEQRRARLREIEQKLGMDREALLLEAFLAILPN